MTALTTKPTSMEAHPFASPEHSSTVDTKYKMIAENVTVSYGGKS